MKPQAGYARLVPTPVACTETWDMQMIGKISAAFGIAAMLAGMSVAAKAETIRFSDGVYNGQVAIYNINGKRKRLPNGYGTASFNSGSKYVGYFHKGRYNGRGVLHFSRGGYCSANFEKGKMHGGADCRYASGAKYVGNMKFGKRNGDGGMTYPDGAYYGGNWRNGKPHGSGNKKYANGNQYKGYWRNGRKHGEGAIYYYGGGHYVGFWSDGKRHGPGLYINTAKRKQVCLLFRNGKKIAGKRHTGPNRAACYDRARSWR